MHQQNKTSMEKINLCEGVVAQMMDTEAWSNISGYLRETFFFNQVGNTHDVRSSHPEIS